GFDPVIKAKILAKKQTPPIAGNDDDDNYWALVEKFRLGPSTGPHASLLTGGDAMSTVENGILTEDPEYSYAGAPDDLAGTDIYKVHHHGSNSSSGGTFLDKMSPKIAVPIDGGSSDSHPNQSVLDRLISRKAVIYRPDMDGNVMIKADSEGNYDVVRTVVYPDLPWAGFENNDTAYSDKAPPALPEGLTVLESTKDHIKLDWTDTTEAADGSPITSSYHVFRSTIEGGDDGAGKDIHPGMSEATGIYKQLTSTPVSVSEYSDTDIEFDKMYYYRVSAVRTDTYYERRYSAEASAHTFFDPPGRIADLSAFPGPADREIKLTWTAPGETDYIDDNRPGAEYSVKYATYAAAGSTTAAAAWWESAELYVQDWEVGPLGSAEEKIAGGFRFSFGTTYYFAVKTADAFGNVSVISSTPTPGTLPQVDVTSPTVVAGEVSPVPDARSVLPSDFIETVFSEGMSSSTVKEALSLHKIKDNFSRLLDAESIGYSFIKISSSVYRMVPDSPLEKGYTYSVSVTTSAMDLATITHPGDRRHSMETAYSWNFTVLMDKDKKNRAVSSDGTWAEFSPGTFSEDYRVEISEPQNRADIIRANRNLASRDSGSAPLAVREFKIYGAAGNFLNSSFSGKAQINIPYGYSDKYEQTTAAIWRLDNESEIWVRIPEAEKSAGSLRAAVYHFSVFGVLTRSATDLGDAFAYPVPYNPNDGRAESGTPGEGIKFKNLSSGAKIKIYTLSGEHVRTLDYEYNRDGEPFTWDTKDTAGSKVPGGLYFYRIYNDDDEITGRLVIVR
ncbi:MAG: Ig-like domain-containing protein, partial [Elusimicrobiota bacterium]|nr:Ig-like domain-containing protein [Elusimicrobiota bacterium]